MMIHQMAVTIGALVLIACTPAATATEAENKQLPSTASTAGALDNTSRAPRPGTISGNATCDAEAAYCPSPVQLRVDRSFSPFAIDTQFNAARDQLTRVDSEGCAAGEGCDWRDRNGVLHFISGDRLTDQRFLIKIVEASDFVGRPIGALGIGAARRQTEVIANVRRFIPEVEIDCNPQHVSGNVGPVECGATLNPGWIQIGFDEDGNLLRVRFDGYQFT